MTFQTYFRIVVTLSFIAFLSACGSSNSPNETQNLSSTGTTDSKPLVRCNKAGSSTLSFKVAAQVSGAGYDPNWANVFLSNLPTGFEAETSFIAFFKGQAVSDSSISYNSTTVPFAIYDTVSQSYLNSSATYSSLKWSEVKGLISGATPASFMSRVIFVLSLQDPTGAYQVLTAQSYNVSDNSSIEAIPSLLPTFYANPADYAIKSNGGNRETVLKNMHPLKNATGDFSYQASLLCN
jgi:hypothetical protein